MAKRVAVVNGPNLNMLGKREIGIYGGLSLEQVCATVASEAKRYDVVAEFFQSNSEGELVSYHERSLADLNDLQVEIQRSFL